MNKKLWQMQIAFIALLFAAECMQAQVTVRPFLTIGNLMGAPSATDLGYINISTGGGYGTFSMKKTTFGGGAQFLFALSPGPGNYSPFSLGCDFGWQKLWSSVEDVGDEGNIGGVDIYADNFTDAENEVRVLALVEFAPQGQPFFAQAGLGVHIVSWSWTHTYESNYSNSYKTNSNGQTNFGWEIAGGANLFSSENVTIPVLLRLDFISRYGTMVSADIMVGASFKI